MMESTGWVEDGFAIAALRFTLCRAFVGVTGSYVFTSKYWIPAFAGMTIVCGEDIGALADVL